MLIVKLLKGIRDLKLKKNDIIKVYEESYKDKYFKYLISTNQLMSTYKMIPKKYCKVIKGKLKKT